jgi:protein-S-isoprenylcysteine O-methyltransferase Ste14
MLRSAFILALQLLPPTFLVFAGWGFDHLSDFFSNPARCGLAALTLIAALAAIVFRLDASPLRRGATPLGSQSIELIILLVLSLALLWFLPFADRRNILTLNHQYWRYFGLLLCVAGIIVRLLALKALGKQFSAYVTLQPDHRLVQHGIYAIIRHPLYLSLLLLPAGVALVFASYLALPILLLAAAFVFDRIRKEERLLATHFPTEFDRYKLRTRRLVPGVF